MRNVFLTFLALVTMSVGAARAEQLMARVAMATRRSASTRIAM
jgi:hypothetical protein